MPWEFTAKSSDELMLVRSSLPESASATVAGELMQMVRLLQAIAMTDIPEYPFSACHTGEKGVPDFQLESGSRRISVEMAKVTSTNLEHARSLQAKIKRTLMETPFIRSKDEKLKRPGVLNKGFMIPAAPELGPTIEEERDIWLKRVCDETTDKTKVLAHQDFLHGDEDWLVLWDRLGTPSWDIDERAARLAQKLNNCWKPGWFSKVFVQDAHFEWQLMFSADGIVRLS